MLLEIGHNLGLAHSGRNNVSYGDRSGMMGYSYNRDNGPMQCFNPAKTYQLGWFDDKTVEVNPNDGTWVGTIIGAADYSNDNVDPNANVIVKIVTGGSKDFYLGYNRKKDINSGVVVAGDAVTIVEQESGYSKSDFLASLPEEGSSETFFNFGGTDKNLVVEFLERGPTYNEVEVAIYFDSCAFPTCCQGLMCAELLKAPDLFVNVPVQLLAPSVAPTAKPSVAPTAKPTVAPTTLEPTDAPTTPEPTGVPTTAEPTSSSTTFSPTVSTTTLEPTNKPTFRPTDRRPLRERWTRKPISAPTTNEPTPAPTNKPTLAPSQKPIYSISYNNNRRPQKVRKQLMTETFRNDLGFFYNSGEVEVTQELFSWVLTARFPLESPSVQPALSTMLALQGTSTIDVTFWYNAEKMEANEGFKLQYSTDFGSSWTDVSSYVFGEGGFDTTDKWNLAQQETFEVDAGMDMVMIRIIGETNLGLSDSVFHVAGINIYGA